MSGRWARAARRVRVPMGFAFAAFCLWRARPTGPSIAMSLPVVLPGMALRGLASGHVRKNTELTVTGPYAYTRNPLYLGSMLMAYGFAGASRSRSVAAVLSLLFPAIYLPVIAAEEEFLLEHFPEFATYREQVPRLLPRLWSGHERGTARTARFSPALFFAHREYNAALGVAAIYGVLLAVAWRTRQTQTRGVKH